eukprot:4696328-Alexandrium_andersonii.AAC.1
MRNMQNRFRRSNLELRGPRSGLENGSRSLRAVRSAQSFVEIPGPPTKAGLEGAWAQEVANIAGSDPQSANPQSAQSLARGAREPNTCMD